MLNQSYQPTQFGHFSIWIPLISNEVANSEKFCMTTDSSWVSLRFRCRVFSFYFTDGASCKNKMVSQKSQFFILHIGFNGKDFLVSDLCVLIANFLVCVFCYLPLNKPGLRYLCSCSRTDMGYTWRKAKHIHNRQPDLLVREDDI
jgi:hypothetical protein